MTSATLDPWQPPSAETGPALAAARAPHAPPLGRQASQPSRDPIAISWVHPRGLVGLGVTNFLLRIATLGTYHFWGKTEVRRRVWSAIRLNGEPLVYTGTGGELFRGFLFVFGAVLLPILLGSFAVTVIFGPRSTATGIFQIVLYLALTFLFGLAVHRAQRYRLARTRWRGIAGGMGGSATRYGWTYFWTLLLVLPTLGWILPWRETRLQRILVSDMRLGNRPLSFTARSGKLYRRFAVVWLGVIVLVPATFWGIGGLMLGLFGPEAFQAGQRPDPATLVAIAAITYGGLLIGFLLYSLLSAWYRAGLMNHFAAHTFVDGARFRLTATAAGLVRVALTNFLIRLAGALGLILALALVALPTLLLAMSDGMTLEDLNGLATPATTVTLIAAIAGFGILAPVTQARTTRYLVQRLSLEGGLPLAEIAQGAADAIRRGEGLAQAFDVDAF